MSIRALADKHKVHRRTVRQALDDAVPPVRKPPARMAPVLGPYEATIRGWLVEDLTAPRKQRHTARRVWQRLLEEEEAVVAESSVRNLVAQLRVEVGGARAQVMVPQTHPPAAEAEVDFGEFQAGIAGVVMKLFMFCLRLSHSGKAVHVAYANQSQESFLDGHVRAFEALGGVPAGMIRYDNLTRRSSGSRSAASGWRTPGSSRCARTTATTRSSASPASREPMRRAASKGRSAGSDAAI